MCYKRALSLTSSSSTSLSAPLQCGASGLRSCAPLVCPTPMGRGSAHVRRHQTGLFQVSSHSQLAACSANHGKRLRNRVNFPGRRNWSFRSCKKHTCDNCGEFLWQGCQAVMARKGACHDLSTCCSAPSTVLHSNRHCQLSSLQQNQQRPITLNSQRL